MPSSSGPYRQDPTFPTPMERSRPWWFWPLVRAAAVTVPLFAIEIVVAISDPTVSLSVYYVRALIITALGTAAWATPTHRMKLAIDRYRARDLHDAGTCEVVKTVKYYRAMANERMDPQVIHRISAIESMRRGNE